MHIREPLINEGTARHSERAIRMFSKAIKCSVFDVRCLHDSTGDCTFNERGMSIDAIARLVPKLRQRNVNGSGVFIRPCRPFAIADDVCAGTLERMLDDELRVTAVIETSPGSYQVWVPLAGPLQTIDEAVCASACDRLVELYGTDPGVAHRDSFGRAPGFFNRKPEHDHDGSSPLVEMSNRHSRFRGYDRTLLDEARRLVANHSELLAERSVGGVLSNDDLSAFGVYKDKNHVVTFSDISTDNLFQNWLTDMVASGYVLPQRANGHHGTDRSQRDLDVLRSMCIAGVPQTVAQAALKAGSDKAQDRGPSYAEHLISSVWGET